MDQNSTNGTDKRNWRERLGIGSKEMPRISEEFQPAPAASKVAATVKPAPMAPRAAPRPVSAAPVSRPISQSSGPIDQDALASKLKSQREAAEKLAEQRVHAARQRAEAAIIAPSAAAPVANGVARPKFSFAEEPPRAAAPVPQQRPQQAVPIPQQAQRAPALPPARPQLGAGGPPRTAAPQYQPRQPLAPPPPNYQSGYNGTQGYRPIDPATGYPQAPQYQAGQSYAPPRQPYGSQQPRLQVPVRQGQDYGYEGQRGNPRMGAPYAGRGPALQSYGEHEQDDIFEQAPVRGQRRATAGDYQQAYREVESGYEDEIPRSRGPGILLALLALALVVGFGSVWAYNNYIKPQTTVASGDKVPVVKAPDTPAKVSGDGTAGDPAAANGQSASPSKKQIYDRIVGDREVLGGQIVPTEETPVQPANNSQPIPEPTTDVPALPSTTGDDGTPLPLPPPPGDSGGQQGSLEPSGKTDQQVANITPAAGASQAADSPSGAPVLPILEAPVPGEQIAAAPPQVQPPAPSTEVVADAAPEVKPVIPAKKIAEPKPIEAKKIVVAEPIKSLGSKPVVLVAPAQKIVANKTPDATVAAAPIGSESIYGDTAVGGGLNQAPAPQIETPVVKKKKSLFDLFKGETKTPDAVDNNVALNTPVVQGQPELLPPVKQVVPAVPTSTAYVAQLASFKTKDQATQEYRNLSAKHGPIISRYAPIITQSQVAGATRYRLSIGPMATENVAKTVCQSLFAAGERDCLVHRQ